MATEPVQLGGIVKNWDPQLGFGYVTPDCSAEDVYVHHGVLVDGEMLLQGSSVTMDVTYNAQHGRFEALKCVGALPAIGGCVGVHEAVRMRPGGGCGVTDLNGFTEAGVHGNSRTDAAPSDNLFVAGLPLDITEEHLRNVFGAYGSVAQCKVLPPNTARSDRAALVRMASMDQAVWIVENVNRSVPAGLSVPIVVRFADLLPPSPSDNLFIAGLPLEVTEQTLWEIFRSYGSVTRLRLLPPTAGKPDRAALVQMSDTNQAKWIVENLNQRTPPDRKSVV